MAGKLIRPPRSAFRFNETTSTNLSDASVDQVIRAVSEKQESIRFEALEGKEIDPTGAIEGSGMRFSKHGFQRLTAALDVPKRFIDDIGKYNPTLAATLLNDVIRRKARGLELAIDGDVVAGVVTQQYSRLHNIQVAEMVADVTGADKFKFLKLEGLRMRLNYVDSGTMADISNMSRNRELVAQGLLRKGDVVGGGIDIFNGEDGGTAFNVSSYLYRLVCANGMIGPRGPGGPGGSGSKFNHRGSGLKEKAMVAIQRAQDLCATYLEKAALAGAFELNALDVKEIADILRNTFSLTFCNSVFEKATEESVAEDHAGVITLYNVFNGITWQAHSVRSLERGRVIEEFAAKLLDRFENQLRAA